MQELDNFLKSLKWYEIVLIIIIAPQIAVVGWVYANKRGII